MKRALLFASLPLTACSSSAPRQTYYYYVDSRDFDDGGYFEQACTGCPPYLTCLGAAPFDLGVAQVECANRTPTGGRRPAELVRGDTDGVLVGRWLAEAAQIEAASMPAFEILARELEAHDAPPSLIARALASADDERRHARIMASLARAHGATPGPVRVVVREPRDLAAIARENAVEGLVREAYGARVAIDPAIGADEQRHAALAADVHAWIRPRLPYAARLRVDEARDAARAQLVAECAVELPRAVRDALGLPDATRAVELAHLV
ncbi:MAG TPA: hypothetical protein VF997_20765 [Polyangia bacterium]